MAFAALVLGLLGLLVSEAYTSGGYMPQPARLRSVYVPEQANETNNPKSYIAYSTVTGFFLQDLNSTNATTFDYTKQNFGLINQTYSTDDAGTVNLSQWQRFERQVYAFNKGSPDNVDYKVVWFGRHGEGYHNTAESYFGTPAWNCYWAELDGNGTSTWDDANLTPNGIAQAQIAHDFWAHEIAVQKIPLPQSYYTSPLSRCLETANVTFEGLDLPEEYPFVPTVKELLRESIDIHTCDRRSNRTYIQNSFPWYKIEPGFTEQDELWNGLYSETNADQVARSRIVLDQIFSSDVNTFLSVTSHSGQIGAILQAIGHIPFSLNTGAVIPVLIKVETRNGTNSATPPGPRTTSDICPGLPVTSLSFGGCVCSGASATTISAPLTATPASATSV